MKILSFAQNMKILYNFNQIDIFVNKKNDPFMTEPIIMEAIFLLPANSVFIKGIPKTRHITTFQDLGLKHK